MFGYLHIRHKVLYLHYFNETCMLDVLIKTLHQKIPVWHGVIHSKTLSARKTLLWKYIFFYDYGSWLVFQQIPQKLLHLANLWPAYLGFFKFGFSLRLSHLFLLCYCQTLSFLWLFSLNCDIGSEKQGSWKREIC